MAARMPGWWLISRNDVRSSIAQAPEEGGEFHHAGGIERSEGLVRDDQGGPAGEGLGDGHALPFAAGEFVGIGGQDAAGSGDAGERQQFGRVAFDAVGAQDFGDLPADAQDRIEGQQRILEDHGDLRAAHRFQRAFVEREQIAPAQQHLSADAYWAGGSSLRRARARVVLPRTGIAREAGDGSHRNVEGNSAQNAASREQL